MQVAFRLEDGTKNAILSRDGIGDTPSQKEGFAFRIHRFGEGFLLSY